MAKSKQLPGQLDMFDLIEQNDWRRRVKAIKVSPAMWELLKANSIDINTLPEFPKEFKGYIAQWDGIPVVVDDDVFSYEFEFEGEENE